MRQRLSWEMDKEKKADMEKKADPYTMNQDHKNNPVQKYDIGGPSQFAEDPDMKTPWKTEGRTETGHPAPEREAVMAARKMEDKAMKCLTIAQRMLPGASDQLIEEQATEFMYMPEQSVLSTLQRQASWAETLAAKDEDEEEEEKEAAKKEETTPEPEKKEEEKEAKKEEEEEEKEAAKKEEEEEEKEAAKAQDEEEDKKEEEKEASEEEKKPVAEEKEAKKEDEEEEKEAAKAQDEEEEKKEEEKEASEEEVDLLDSLFAMDETKTGAKKLSGIVKQASSDGGNLDSLWKSSTPPDVSEAFK